MRLEPPPLPKPPEDIEDEHPDHKGWTWVICGESQECTLNENSETIWCDGYCRSEHCECVPIRQRKGPTPEDPQPKWRRFKEGSKHLHPDYWYACVCVLKEHRPPRG